MTPWGLSGRAGSTPYISRRILHQVAGRSSYSLSFLSSNIQRKKSSARNPHIRSRLIHSTSIILLSPLSSCALPMLTPPLELIYSCDLPLYNVAPTIFVMLVKGVSVGCRHLWRSSHFLNVFMARSLFGNNSIFASLEL